MSEFKNEIKQTLKSITESTYNMTTLLFPLLDDKETEKEYNLISNRYLNDDERIKKELIESINLLIKLNVIE